MNHDQALVNFPSLKKWQGGPDQEALRGQCRPFFKKYQKAKPAGIQIPIGRNQVKNQHFYQQTYTNQHPMSKYMKFY